MSSEVKANKLSPATGTDVTLGDSGDTFTVPSGATLDVSSATMTGFTIPSGQTLTVASGGTITNSGTASGFGGTNTPAFEAYPTSYLNSHAGNTWVKFEMGTEVFDTDGCFDSSTNYRFTPTTAGKYFCYAQVTYNGVTDGVRILSAFYKNGSIDSVTRTSMVSAGANEGSTSCRYIFDMNGSTDYIEFYGIRDGSTTRYYLGYGTYFGAYRILT